MTKTPSNTARPTATYTRLRSGEWGVRVPEAVDRLEPGATTCVVVHKRSGEAQAETVRCFWSGEAPNDGTRVALCDIVRRDGASS